MLPGDHRLRFPLPEQMADPERRRRLPLRARHADHRRGAGGEEERHLHLDGDARRRAPHAAAAHPTARRGCAPRGRSPGQRHPHARRGDTGQRAHRATGLPHRAPPRPGGRSRSHPRPRGRGSAQHPCRPRAGPGRSARRAFRVDSPVIAASLREREGDAEHPRRDPDEPEAHLHLRLRPADQFEMVVQAAPS